MYIYICDTAPFQVLKQRSSFIFPPCPSMQERSLLIAATKAAPKWRGLQLQQLPAKDLGGKLERDDANHPGQFTGEAVWAKESAPLRGSHQRACDTAPFQVLKQRSSFIFPPCPSMQERSLLIAATKAAPKWRGLQLQQLPAKDLGGKLERDDANHPLLVERSR